jgi:signal transduction histidine kinase
MDSTRSAPDLAPRAAEPPAAADPPAEAASGGTSTAYELRQLAAAMAHEVRNPLNSMAIHVELLEGRLKRGGADLDGALRSVTVLQGEIARIDRVLDEYLAHAGPAEAPRRPSDPRALVEAALGRQRARAEELGVRLSASFAAPLAHWIIDAEGFGEALDALLHNAVLASPRGGAVEVLVSSDGDHADVVVRDQGAGIAAEDLPRVFLLGFSRWGRAGLGLTVAKQIVKGHGGSIMVEASPEARGARVRVRLPLDHDG